MKTIATIVLIAMAASLAAPGFAQQAPKPKAGQNMSVRPSAGLAPLSAGECRGLGGKVVAATSMMCKIGSGSGAKECATVDGNGVVRRVCINE